MPEKSTPPFFSVIVATYNRGNLLKRALGSLLLQTETDWEALVIDDGSTDQTGRILEIYRGKSTKIRCIKQENKGVVAAKNRGLFSAKGKYVTFLDSDDEFRPEHLRFRKDILDENRAVDFLYGGVEVIGNEFVPDRFDPKKKIPIAQCAVSGTFFIRKEIIRTLEGFRKPALSTDADLFDRAKKMGVKRYKTDLPTYIYHHDTEGSITNALMP